MPEFSNCDGPDVHKLYLLRHSIVASHRGDVPLTHEGHKIARAVGGRLGASQKPVRLLYGSTLRARQTAEAIAQGASAAGGDALPPKEAFALRNPDIYVAGVRVNLVSSVEAVAEQVDGLSIDAAARVPFFQGFLGAKDRVGWWLWEPDPPGENAAAVAKRIVDFAGSLVDLSSSCATTIAVTHSPVLRACAIKLLSKDPGEPDWVAGLLVSIKRDRTLHVTMLEHAP